MHSGMSMHDFLSRLASMAMLVSLLMHEAMCREKPLCGGGEPIRVHVAVGLARKEVSLW